MNNILNIHSFPAFDLATLGNDLQGISRPDPGFGHTQLTTGERLTGQIKSSHAQGLALCLVDGHGKCWPQRELPAPELERQCRV